MGTLQFAVPIIAIVALVAIVLSGRWRARKISVNASSLPAIEGVIARIRLRNVVALVAAFVVGIALAHHGLTVAADLGRSLLIAPLVTAAVAIAFFVIIPAFTESTTVRSAELNPRTVLSVAGTPTLVIAAALTMGLLVTTLVWGFVAEPDGRSIGNDFDTTDYYSTASPFPGFFYGVPVLVALAVLVAVAIVALVRIAAVAAPSDEDFRAADASVRQLAVSVIMRVVAAGIALTLAAGLYIASQASASVSSTVLFDGEGGTQLVRDEALRVFVIVEASAAAMLLVVGLVLAVSAVLAAVRRPVEASDAGAAL